MQGLQVDTSLVTTLAPVVCVCHDVCCVDIWDKFLYDKQQQTLHSQARVTIPWIAPLTK